MENDARWFYERIVTPYGGYLVDLDNYIVASDSYKTICINIHIYELYLTVIFIDSGTRRLQAVTRNSGTR